MKETSTRKSIPKELYAIRPAIWVLWFCFDWAVIVGTLAGIHYFQPPWWSYPIWLVLIGSRQHGLGLLGHEATHRIAFRNRRINDWIGELFVAWPLLIVLSDGYRPWHFAHHRSLGTLQDSELAYRSGWAYQGRVTWRRIAVLFLGDLVGLGIPELLNFLVLVLPYQRPYRILGPVLLYAVVGLVLWQFGLLYLLGIWVLALLTGFWAVFRVRAFGEHVGLPLSGKESSHRFEVGPIGRFLFFPRNTWCHYEHHLWPQVPFYHLPSLRALEPGKPVLRFHELFPWH